MRTMDEIGEILARILETGGLTEDMEADVKALKDELDEREGMLKKYGENADSEPPDGETESEEEESEEEGEAGVESLFSDGEGDQEDGESPAAEPDTPEEVEEENAEVADDPAEEAQTDYEASYKEMLQKYNTLKDRYIKNLFSPTGETMDAPVEEEPEEEEDKYSGLTLEQLFN